MSSGKIVGLYVLAAAGTVLGMSAIAAAQSAVRVEPRVIVREGKPLEERELRVQVEGQPGEEREVRVFVHGDEGEKPAKKAMARVEAKARGEAKKQVVVRKLDGGGQGCEDCGCCGGGEGKGDGRSEGGKRTIEKTIRLGGGHGEGGARAFIVGPHGEPHEFKFEHGDGRLHEHMMKLYGQGGAHGGKHKVQVHTFGPGEDFGAELGDKIRREVETRMRTRGQGDGAAKFYGEDFGPEFGEKIRKEVEQKMRTVRPLTTQSFGATGPGPVVVQGFGEGGAKKQVRVQVHGEGHGGGQFEQHVVVIGPDGQRREWRSGGDGGAKAFRRQGGDGEPQIFEFRDGEEGGRHLFVQPLERQAPKRDAGPERIQLRRPRPMNVI